MWTIVFEEKQLFPNEHRVPLRILEQRPLIALRNNGCHLYCSLNPRALWYGDMYRCHASEWLKFKDYETWTIITDKSWVNEPLTEISLKSFGHENKVGRRSVVRVGIKSCIGWPRQSPNKKNVWKLSVELRPMKTYLIVEEFPFVKLICRHD